MLALVVVAAAEPASLSALEIALWSRLQHSPPELLAQHEQRAHAECLAEQFLAQTGYCLEARPKRHPDAAHPDRVLPDGSDQPRLLPDWADLVPQDAPAHYPALAHCAGLGYCADLEPERGPGPDGLWPVMPGLVDWLARCPVYCPLVPCHPAHLAGCLSVGLGAVHFLAAPCWRLADWLQQPLAWAQDHLPESHLRLLWYYRPF